MNPHECADPEDKNRKLAARTGEDQIEKTDLGSRYI
jgi:hypothetical protein